MSSKDKVEDIYSKIENKDINLYDGIILLISLLVNSEKNETVLMCETVLKKLSKNYGETLEVYKRILESDQKAIIRLSVAKELISDFGDKSERFLKNIIQKDLSALFITEFYRFLINQKDIISQNLKNTIISKYKKIYNVISEEAVFFVDLEATQINSKKDIDFEVGYFKKFCTSKIHLLGDGSQFSCVIRKKRTLALDIRRWEFEFIPVSINSLSKLGHLNISNLQLKIIPETISKLSELKYLNLSGNRLTHIPKWLIEFIEGNNLMPYALEDINKSDSLVLSLIEILCGEKIHKAQEDDDVLAWETGLNYKINKRGRVIGLYIKDEKVELGIFPEQICSLEFLQELDLPKSSIESIPKCIGELNSLKFLNLSLNRIKSIPESINKLTNLEYMNINDNLIPEKEILDLKWNKNGLIPLENGDFDRTIEECETTLKTYPKNKLALFHLGIAFREKGRFDSAKQAYLMFLKIDPQSSVVWSSLSDIYHQLGEYEKAISAIKHALDIEPDIALLWSNLGLNYKKLGKYNDAIESYLHSLMIDKTNKYVWKDLASIYRDKGEIMKAIEAEERALKVSFNLDEKLD
ncbi:MAG: tetratricopeptide repeat protein [Promethearchaeota archaeon]|jgi:tetratricopeptide (TPR) repeat protein